MMSPARTCRRMIECLQRDATLSVQQLAEAVGLSPTPVWRRLKTLQDAGVLRARVTLMDREKLGLAVCVLAHVTLVRHTEGVVEDFERMVRASPEILECASTRSGFVRCVARTQHTLRVDKHWIQSRPPWRPQDRPRLLPSPPNVPPPSGGGDLVPPTSTTAFATISCRFDCRPAHCWTRRNLPEGLECPDLQCGKR